MAIAEENQLAKSSEIAPAPSAPLLNDETMVPETKSIQNSNQPIATQPRPVVDFNRSARAQACPSGLEHLAQVDQLLVREEVNFQIGNSFHIKNIQGATIYHAIEVDDCCAQCCMKASERPFEMQIFDNNHSEVIHLSRPYSCFSTESIEVTSPGGQVFGRIKQIFTFLTPKFEVMNHNNQTVLFIKGPVVRIGEATFKVYTMDGTEIGCIEKQWSGLARELFTAADHFGINFPINLDVRTKATLLGACLLINSMYYDRN